MELELVNFKQAKDLKELGFPQPPLTLDNCYGVTETPTVEDLTLYHGFCCFKPTLELVAKWLRDKKNLHLDMYYDTEFNIWRSSISEENEEEFVSQSYEEAFSAGIDKAIEILKIIKYGKDN